MVLLAGVANTAYGLLQAFGLDPLPWNQGFGGRAGGFFGNPDLLGGHLALLLPLALALALDDAGSSLARAARWAVALMLALGLFATQTRGAWVGAGVGVALLLALVRGGHAALWQRQRLRLAWAAGGLLLLAALWAGTHPQVWQRWADTAQGSDPEAGRRAFLMTKTAQLALRHPLLGQGPGAFRIAFTSVEAQGIAPKDLATQPYVMSEHGHDDVLQWAADAGWPAALLWVALLAALASALWPRRASEAPGAGPGRDPLLVLGVLGSLTALQVHGLINYPYLMLPTQGVAWGLAGLALALSRRAEPQPAAAAAPPAPPAPRATRWPAWALLLAAAGALVWSGRRLAEDHLWWVAEGEQHLKNNDAASTLLVRTLAFDRREDRLWRLHGQSESDRGFIWNSIGSLREAVRLSPYDAEAAVRLGRACVENRLFDEAEAVLFKVAGYAPNFVDVWEPLAAAYYNQGKFKEAVEAYDWMLYFHVNDESAYANKAAAEGSLGKLPQALVTLNSAEQALPNSGKIKLNLAITYLKLGMRPQAQAAWKQASQLIPSDPQVDQLRKALH
jgi:tetratricopeptide (TPR) repeat protein